MELTLHTETFIDSAHQLFGYNGKCSNLHGHTWRIEVWFKGNTAELDCIGILVDFGIIKELEEILDHKNLNKVLKCNPTAENLTNWIYDWLIKKINHNIIETKVRVYETSLGKETWCEGGDW